MGFLHPQQFIIFKQSFNANVQPQPKRQVMAHSLRQSRPISITAIARKYSQLQCSQSIRTRGDKGAETPCSAGEVSVYDGSSMEEG